MGFKALDLHAHILKAIDDAGYGVPTPVQSQAIPAALAGRDLLVSSQTGSGKTAAFMLPALHRLADDARSQGRGPRLLVLTPTRELAQQVAVASQKYGRHLRQARVVSVVGGMAYPAQNRLLAQRHEVLVATPGRLIDQIERGRVDFSRLEMLVLDEADRMLDMGFIDDIERIIARLPAQRQTLLFSATIDARIARLAQRLLNDPLRIEIDSPTQRHEHIEQRLLYADGLGHKNRLLDHILRDVELEQAIVFTATKRDADALAGELEQTGFAAAALHGDMKQSLRNRTLSNMRRGSIRVLVATDVAARGLDVRGVTHVINFDLPRSAEDYVHRIGRTGRAGDSGIAISLAHRNDVGQVKAIERYTRQTIPVHTIPGLEPKSTSSVPANKSGKPQAQRRGADGWRNDDRRAGRASRDGDSARQDRHQWAAPGHDGAADTRRHRRTARPR
jgi:superfamily II DNA/RNA helicase